MIPMDKLQELHDRMIASAPEGSAHSETDCMFCTGEYASLVEGAPVADKTYSEDELQAQIASAVVAATAEVQAKLDAAEEAAKKKFPPDDNDEDDKKAAAKAAVDELTAKLDAAVLEAEAAKTERDEVTSWLQAEHDRVLAEAEAETKKADRITQVAAVVTFPEEYVAERASAWVTLDDAQFAALLEDYKNLGVKPKVESTPLPRATAMQASRDADESSTVVGSAVTDLIRGRNYGIDPRAIR